MTSPYESHLCVDFPEEWKNGFDFAEFWVRNLAHPGEAETIASAIFHSDGRAWDLTAKDLRLPATARAEGFALGVFGVVDPKG